MSNPCIFSLQIFSVLLMVVLQVAAHNVAPDPPLHPSTPVHHPLSAHKRVERQGTNYPLSFDQPSCTASVVENSPVGTEVVTVQPHANDERLSGERTYSLQQGGSARYFSVDSSTGVVTTTGNRPPHTTLKALLLTSGSAWVIWSHPTNVCGGAGKQPLSRSALLSMECG